MSYGKEGTIYQVGEDDYIAVNEKFVIATLFAIILAIVDITEGEEISNAIEAIASAVYDGLKETGHGTLQGTTGSTGETPA